MCCSYITWKCFSYFSSGFSLHSHIVAISLEPHEDRLSGIIMSVLDLFFIYGLSRVLKFIQIWELVLLLGKWRIPGEVQIPLCNAQSQVWLSNQWNEHSLLLFVPGWPCSVILWGFCRGGLVHLIIDQILHLVKFRFDTLEICLNNMASFQWFLLMDLLLFAFPSWWIVTLLYIAALSLINAVSMWVK